MPPTAFKLLCDPDGYVFAVEAGEEQYISGCKTGDVFGNAESMQVSLRVFGAFKMTLPPLRVSDVETADVKKVMRCCWRIINGRWQCVPC
jgi:hypothetical protein